VKRKQKRRSKRKWCYAQPPSFFCIEGHDCGNCNLQWSEWKNHVWCDKCKMDFIPKHWGILDGPIPLGLANMMGIRFDRIDLKKNKLIRQEDYLSA